MSDSSKPKVRDAMEVQHAHDTLVNIVTGAVDIGDLSQLNKMVMLATLDTLCWTLKHDHNTQFEEILKLLRKAISDAGYVEQQSEIPFTLADLWKRPS